MKVSPSIYLSSALLGLAVCMIIGAQAAPTSDKKPECRDDQEYFDRGPDCHKYIHCSKGAVEFKECSKELWWNQAKGDCDAKENVNDCPHAGGRAQGELGLQQSDDQAEEKPKPSEWRSPQGWCWGWAIPIQPICTGCATTGVVRTPPRKPAPKPPVRKVPQPKRPPPRRQPPKTGGCVGVACTPVAPPCVGVCGPALIPIQPPVVHTTHLVATPRIVYDYRWVTGYHSGWYGKHWSAVPLKQDGTEATEAEVQAAQEAAAQEPNQEAGGEQAPDEQLDGQQAGDGAQPEQDAGGQAGDKQDGDQQSANKEGEHGDNTEAHQEHGGDNKDDNKTENAGDKDAGQADGAKEGGEHGDQSEHGEQGDQPGELRQPEAKAKN